MRKLRKCWILGSSVQPEHQSSTCLGWVLTWDTGWWCCWCDPISYLSLICCPAAGRCCCCLAQLLLSGQSSLINFIPSLTLSRSWPRVGHHQHTSSTPGPRSLPSTHGSRQDEWRPSTHPPISMMRTQCLTTLPSIPLLLLQLVVSLARVSCH